MNGSLRRRKTLQLASSDPRGSGAPVVFVHGFGHNRSVWEKLAAELPDGLRPIRVDLRGHGESPWSPEGAYDLPDYAADLLRFFDDHAIERAVVVAHSLGGNVATLFADAEPKRMAALALVDTGPTLEGRGAAFVLEEAGNALQSYGSIESFREQLAAIHANGDPELVSRLAETGLVRRLDGRYEPALDPGILGDPASAEVAGSAEASVEHALWAALRGIRCPVLVVRGGLSAFLSEKVAREMVDEALLDGRLVTLAQAGHAVMVDDPDGLASALLDFLDRPRR